MTIAIVALAVCLAVSICANVVSLRALLTRQADMEESLLSRQKETEEKAFVEAQERLTYLKEAQKRMRAQTEMVRAQATGEMPADGAALEDPGWDGNTRYRSAHKDYWPDIPKEEGEAVDA